jgi:branched-chain amino acid transport system substrate-binding protein
LIGLASALGVAGCGSIVTTSGAGPTTTLVPGPTVQLGYLGPLHGPDAAVGKAMQQGAYLAVQEFSTAHPSYNVLLRSENISGTGQSAPQTRKLLAEGVVGVVGPATDAEADVVDPILEAADVPQIAVSATGDDLSEQGDPDFHRLVASDAQSGVDDAAFVDSKDPTSVAVITDASANDGLSTALGEALASDGVLGPQSSVSSGQPPTLVAASILADSPVPDWVVFDGSADNGGQLVEALNLAGYTGSILLVGNAGDPLRAADAAWVLEGDKAYLSCPCDGDSGVTTPQLAFADAYRADYGVAPPEWAAQGFDAANILLDATLPSSSPTGGGSGAAGSGAGGASTGSPTSTTASASPSSAAHPAPVVVTAKGIEGVLAAATRPYVGVSGSISFASDGDLGDAPVWIWNVANGKVTQETNPVAVSDAGTGS